MLRGIFALGIIAIFCVWILGLAVLAFGQWVGLNLSFYVSTALILLILVWIGAMVGIGAKRIARFFAKPS